MATSTASALDAGLSNLATGAAHDLRNVLFVIRAHCEQLLASTPPQDPRREGLDAIKDAIDRGARLASQLVANGRSNARAQVVDVNETIRGIEPLVRRLVGDRVSVSTSLSRTPWLVPANAVQVEQIVMNLAVNARDAMPDGGRLTIATESRTLTGAGPGQPSQFVVIAVTDNGHGIDPAIQDRVFEPYFTTKGSQGTGVGLATVRAIALLNGGHVEMATSPGDGTTVRVVMPRARAGAEPPASSASTTTMPGRRERILLVENERAIRDYLLRSLIAEGYDVETASSGAEALSLCDSPRPAVDVVVADVHLPDLDGPSVASRVRAVWPSVGLVFISGDGEGLGAIAGREGVPVLAKPFTTAQLMTAVRSALTPEQDK
jgi:two-component system cell cycle sensor histidine kinase/response regulator CckA